MRAQSVAALVVAALVSGLAGGCAGGPAAPSPGLASDAPRPTSGMVTGSVPDTAYHLSEAELKLDCKKLTGTMQIRILQVKGYDSNKQASLAARGMQSFATPIWGGTKEGLDPEGQHRKDLAMLEAYNARLAEKKCKTLNLAAELGSANAPGPPPEH
jgi:hypothetical protein